MDWAERVAWLELSWARQRVEEYPSKRTKANEGVFRIISDFTCFTIEIPLHRLSCIERKTAVFLRTQRQNHEPDWIELKRKFQPELNYTWRAQIEDA